MAGGTPRGAGARGLTRLAAAIGATLAALAALPVQAATVRATVTTGWTTVRDYHLVLDDTRGEYLYRQHESGEEFHPPDTDGADPGERRLSWRYSLDVSFHAAEYLASFHYDYSFRSERWRPDGTKWGNEYRVVIDSTRDIWWEKVMDFSDNAAWERSTKAWTSVEFSTVADDPPVTAPLPMTGSLLAGGVLLLGLAARRRGLSRTPAIG
jgi:hypothetical protein